MNRFVALLLITSGLYLTACSSRPDTTQTGSATSDTTETATLPPDTFFPVKPVTTTPNRMQPSLQISQGRFFSFALPNGWRVAEDGQFALTLLAPDQKALTVMVGNAGMPLNYPPGRFVYEKLMAIQPEQLQLSQPVATKPIPGFSQAWQFEVTYFIQSAPCKGRVTCHIQPAYDSCVMAMTAALSDATQWAGYANWLPLVADQISAINGAAFGMRGIMQQNLTNSMAFAEAAQRYRDWSSQNWKQVTDERGRSTDQQQEQFRETLGGVQTYSNPYNTNQPLELPNTYQHYWIDRQGNVVGTDNPGVDPNVGSTQEWRPLQPRRR
jgi:hypothetical protein